MYSYSPTLSQISLKNSFGKQVFQILTKIEMTGRDIFFRTPFWTYNFFT